MKKISTYGTNITTPPGRTDGQFNNDPGGGLGSGVEAEADNDNIYAVIAPINSWKEGGISDSDETTVNSDMRDALEEMVSKKVVGLSDFVSGTTYSAPGTLTDLVMWKGFQFINISNVNNLGNDPLLNPTLWMKIPKVDKLMDLFYEGEPKDGSLSPVADRSSGKYLQNLLFGNYRLGGNGDTFYNFYRVALDGTQVTGNATLEAIFDPGGANEYFNIDIIAPDSLGTRTLIDMSSRHLAPQSSGGDNDVLGGVLEDRVQGHHHNTQAREGSTVSNETQTLSLGDNAKPIATSTAVREVTTDGVNGTPRIGATTRPKEFTVGSSYIIVMIPA